CPGTDPSSGAARRVRTAPTPITPPPRRSTSGDDHHHRRRRRPTHLAVPSRPRVRRRRHPAPSSPYPPALACADFGIPHRARHVHLPISVATAELGGGGRGGVGAESSGVDRGSCALRGSVGLP